MKIVEEKRIIIKAPPENLFRFGFFPVTFPSADVESADMKFGAFLPLLSLSATLAKHYDTGQYFREFEAAFLSALV